MGASRYSCNRQAVSLVEVVLATGILAIGITVVLQALSYSAQAAGASCDVTQAAFLAANTLQELELKAQAGLISQEPPEVTDTVGKFTLTYSIAQEPEAGFSILDIGVSWQRLRQERSLDLATYLP